MKRIISLCLVLVLVFAFSISAYALSNYCSDGCDWRVIQSWDSYEPIGDAGHWYIQHYAYMCYKCTCMETEDKKLAYPHVSADSCSLCGWHA